LPKGWPVEVTYEYLTNGRLDVQAKLPGTSRGVELELQREQSLTSEQMGKWKKVIEAAEGFDAFEGMLDDVMQAHRMDRQALKKAAAAVPAALAKPTGELISEDELSAASQAFAEVQAELASDEPQMATKSTGTKTSTKAGDSKVATNAAKEPAAAARDRAGSVGQRGAVQTRPTPAAPTASASAPAVATSMLKERAANSPTAGEPKVKKAVLPAVMWLMTLGAMLLVSLIALLVFYYLIAHFTKMGDFLHLKLPGLPVPKAQSTTSLHAALADAHDWISSVIHSSLKFVIRPWGPS
jgi:hypothetical protein